MARAGQFYFSTTKPGTYSIPAFVDRNQNLHFEVDEPAIGTTAASTFVLAEGAIQQDIRVEIGADDRIPVDGPIDIRELEARSVGDQIGTTIGQLAVEGEIIALADPKLGRENGDMGLWHPYDFVFEVGSGVYFLEPYDPTRTPVLFVHGIGGIPQDFTYLIERLDRSRFQPWLFYYPSGAKLDPVSKFMSEMMARLELEHGIERFFVVAHSMGGLVARGFLLHHAEALGSNAAQLFGTFSTPWNGHKWAQLRVDLAPIAVHSWIDIAPGSDFLRGLFYRDGGTRRELPDHLSHHILFGFRRDRSLPGSSGDTVVSVASELRAEAQEEAATTFGYDTDHVGILNREDAAARLNEILVAAE